MEFKSCDGFSEQRCVIITTSTLWDLLIIPLGAIDLHSFLLRLPPQEPPFPKSCPPAHMHAVAPPKFCNRGELRYGSIGVLEYEVPQSRLYCLCINVALCSTAFRCICRVIRRSSMTMKAHTYYIIFGRPPIRGGKLPPSPLAAPLHARTYMYHTV